MLKIVSNKSSFDISPVISPKWYKACLISIAIISSGIPEGIPYNTLFKAISEETENFFQVAELQSTSFICPRNNQLYILKNANPFYTNVYSICVLAIKMRGQYKISLRNHRRLAGVICTRNFA